MPGKINPVMPELAAMVSFQVDRQRHRRRLAVQAGQLELNVMMPTMAHNVLQSHHDSGQHAAPVRPITASPASPPIASAANYYAQSTVSLATALNPYIGYAKAAEMVKESVATGESIVELAREKKLLSEEEIAEILDPARMTEPQRPLKRQRSAPLPLAAKLKGLPRATNPDHPTAAHSSSGDCRRPSIAKECVSCCCTLLPNSRVGAFPRLIPSTIPQRKVSNRSHSRMALQWELIR